MAAPKTTESEVRRQHGGALERFGRQRSLQQILAWNVMMYFAGLLATGQSAEMSPGAADTSARAT
jgi:hypothetical protein